MIRAKYLFLVVLFELTSCGAFLQNQGTKNFKDPIVKTEYFKSLNKHQQDFFYLKSICEKHFPLVESYFPARERLPLEVEILEKLSQLGITDLEFQLLLKKYLSHFDNQHTRIGLTIYGIYPFIPVNKDSSWYILNLAKGQNRDLLGKRITFINDINVNVYEKKLFEFISAENTTSKRKEITDLWNRPAPHEFLAGRPLDSIKITVDGGKEIWVKKITTGTLEWMLNEPDFKPHPITKPRNRIYDYQLIDSLGITYFQFHECYDKIEIREGIKSYVKPWVRPIANLYVKIQTNRKKPPGRLKKYFDPERPIFSEYVKQMISESNRKGIKKLIIDLRGNNGGSESICLQLLYHLTEREDLKDFSEFVKNDDFYKHYFKNEYKEKLAWYQNRYKREPAKDSLFFTGFAHSNKQLFDKIEDKKSPYHILKDRPVFEGKIVILADHTTHSAGALFATLLQDNKIGTLIGTEVANNPTGPTSWTPFVLPNSRLYASIPSHYLERPDPSKGKNFVPDFWLEKDVLDFRSGKDPLFEKAVELLDK